MEIFEKEESKVKDLENDMFTCRNEYVMFFCSVNDDFDRPSSAKEVLKATKKNKKNYKAYEMDCLLN